MRRDLSFSQTINNSTKTSWKFWNLTPNICIHHCQTLNQSYAGLQESNLCFCGNTYGRYGKLHSASCNMYCAGDKDQSCGGVLKNDVYHVKSSGMRSIMSTSLLFFQVFIITFILKIVRFD